MYNSKTFTIAGAAILGTAVMLGANTANAVIILDPAPETSPGAGDAEMTAQLKYAKETARSLVDDGKTYYVVENGNDTVLHIQSAAGLVQTNDAYEVDVTYTLENMIFTGESELMLTVDGGSAIPPVVGSGGSGDNYVQFTVPGIPEATDELVLQVEEIAVLGDRGGSITVEVMDTTLKFLPNPTDADTKRYSNKQSGSNIISVVNGLAQTVTPMDQTAAVEAGFMEFATATSTATIAHLGKIEIAPDLDGLLRASETEADADDASEAVEAGALFDHSKSFLKFEGDVSFAKSVKVALKDTCESGQSVLNEETRAWEKLAISHIHDSTEGTYIGYLCIEVSGETAIPNTAPYMVTTEYGNAAGTVLTDAGETDNLGRIERGGTNVHIPYLTTYDGYHQRIVIVNRGSVPAKYWFDFHPEDGVTVTRGPAAGSPGDDPDDMRMVPPETRMVLSLRIPEGMDGNVMTIEGGTRTAATLSLEADSKNIDVATVQVNRSTGGVDTVNYN